jgi:hypothetical protein
MSTSDLLENRISWAAKRDSHSPAAYGSKQQVNGKKDAGGIDFQRHPYEFSVLFNWRGCWLYRAVFLASNAHLPTLILYHDKCTFVEWVKGINLHCFSFYRKKVTAQAEVRRTLTLSKP